MTADQINTPGDLCKKIVACVRGSYVRTVADFAAGSGELLRAASSRWGSATFIALDIDAQIVRKLRDDQPCWIVSRGDFLKPRSRSGCVAVQRAKLGVDLILLNPPFSSRGGSRFQIPVGREILSCSRAVAFVISSLPFLSTDGEIVAIIPAGSLKSEKDRNAWALLRDTFSVSVMGINGHDTFRGCCAHTVIVRMARRDRRFSVRRSKCRQLARNAPELVLYRGALQMHDLRKDGGSTDVPLVHSTCLRDGAVDLTQLRVSNASFKVKGPVLFLVRVGEPRRDKIVLYKGGQSFAISDCIIALKGRENELTILQKRLLQSWNSVLALYKGTGAKYITVAELTDLLRAQGFAVRLRSCER